MKKISIILCFMYCSFGQSIQGAGATFPYPIYSVWGYDYNKKNEVKLNYRKIGSGGGVREIKARTADFGASDAPLNKRELEENNLLQFPAIIGAVVPIVNIPEIDPNSLKLSQEAIGDIFSGQIQYWNDEKIVRLNPSLKLPNERIILVYRSDKSGTTAIFTKYLGEVNSSFKSTVGVGKKVRWPKGIQSKGNDGIANYVKRTPYSIGYVNYNFALTNRLSTTYIENKSGEYVLPSFKSFSSAAEYGNWNENEHFNEWLVNSPGKDSWPIAGASFILLAKEKVTSNANVFKFFNFCFENGNHVAEKLMYIPIPVNLQNKIKNYLSQHGLH